jgi:hypothetical protein
MAETYTGQVQNGVIVLDEGTPPLPEGMKVRVEPADMARDLEELRTLLLSVAGRATDVPPVGPAEMAVALQDLSSGLSEPAGTIELDGEGPTLYERLKPIIGFAGD